MYRTFPDLAKGVFVSPNIIWLFKLFSFKHFGEDVCNLFICGTMSHMNSLGIYTILNQMILWVDVLGSIMESRILIQLYWKMFVNQKINTIHLFLLQIFNDFPKPHNFPYCFYSCHIFFLCCGIYWNWLLLWPLGNSYCSKTDEIYWSWYFIFFIHIKFWVWISNQAKVIHLEIFGSKILSSL